MADKKVISFISKDLKRECSFMLEEKVSNDMLEMYFKNAIHSLATSLSDYDKYSQKLVDGYRNNIDIKDIENIRKRRDREFKIGEDKIGLVIIWEDHIFDTYENIKKNGLSSYIKDFIK